MPDPIRCPRCGAHSEMTPTELIAAIKECINCRVDITLRGQWTGKGWAIAQAIKAREPAVVMQALKRFELSL